MLDVVLPPRLLGPMLIWASKDGDDDAILNLANKKVDMTFRDEVSDN